MSWLSLLHPAIPRAGYVKGNDDLLAEQPVAVDNALALVVFRSIYASELEPPIGIEPMTYALRGGLQPSSMVHRLASAPLTRLPSPAGSTVIQHRC